MKLKGLLVLLILVLTGCSVVVPPPEPKPEPVDRFKTIPFTLAQVNYNLPITLQNLFDDGWNTEDTWSSLPEMDYEIAPNTYIRKYYLRNGRNMMAVSLYNPTESPILLKNSVVAEIEGDNRTWREDDVLDLVIYDGITFTTTKEEIKAILGEPTSTRESDLSITWEYKHNQTATTTFVWSKEEEKMLSITISNFKAIEK